MQRQAVPLLQAEAPIVGTGNEAKVAIDSGAAILAKRAGVIDQVDAMRHRGPRDRGSGTGRCRGRHLPDAQVPASNQNTCINQRPLVKVGDLVKKGDVIADGPRPTWGNWPWARTWSSRSCPGTATTTKTRSLISERIVTR